MRQYFFLHQLVNTTGVLIELLLVLEDFAEHIVSRLAHQLLRICSGIRRERPRREPGDRQRQNPSESDTV